MRDYRTEATPQVHTPEAQTPDVLIAGAGPTGLLLALWLTRLGVRCGPWTPDSAPPPRAVRLPCDCRAGPHAGIL